MIEATTRPPLTAIELCCGLGGIGIGLREVGFDVHHAYDAWSDAVDVYNSNDPLARAKVCDLLTSAARHTIAADSKKLGGLDLLVAGPPCKGFSQLKNGRHDGRRSDNRTHNRVLRSIPAFVAATRPRVVLIENVPALETHRGGKTLRELVQALAAPARRLAYDVSYEVYDAAQFGTPQSRRRLLVLGVRKGEKTLMLPRPGEDLRPLFTALRRGRTIPRTLEDAAQALADPETIAPTTAAQALSDLPLRAAGELADTAEYISEAKTSFQLKMRTGQGRLTGMRTPAVREETLHRLRHVPPGGCVLDIPPAQRADLARTYASAYRRLHPDAPSTALSTKYDCVYHYLLPRSLSIREYARLQGIPDWFQFPENTVARRAAYEMIGNSVPPQLIAGVVSKLLQGGS